MQQKSKNFHRHFATPGLNLYWIIIAYIIVGWFYPVIGLLALICMIGPVLTSIWRGRFWCGHVCPRGNMYDRLLSKYSPHKPIPAFVRTFGFRLFMVFFIFGMFGFQLTFTVPWSEGGLAMWSGIGRVFWTIIVMTTIVGIILSFIYAPRTWCSFCPMGTISSWVAPKHQPLPHPYTAVHVAASCQMKCKNCARVCPMQLTPYNSRGQESGYLHPDCLKCGKCTLACPTKLMLLSRCLLACTIAFVSCVHSPKQDTLLLTTPGNPYLPLWEHIPDGEPYVFEDPNHPGQYRVYIYGSHDNLVTAYCGRDQVVWSAPVEDLSKWRYDGVIFTVNKNANGEFFTPDSLADVLFAPDVTLVTAADGSKTYYLYPNDQCGGRNGLVAKSARPDGPFEVCNWNKDNPNVTDGVLRFDPAVFVDDDGRVYGYWGFERSYAAEFDPTTMATVKPGTEIVEDMIPGRYQSGVFNFFEASSIRKIKDKYVFIYSRFTEEGEFGLPSSNYTLAYAYSDAPLGPWTYGGTIIDGRARATDEQGNVIATAYVSGNTHGSICEIAGQWYVFYHRQTGTDEYARQAMVAPIEVTVEEGAGGKVSISEGEYTSEGFALGGLDPMERHPAAIACWLTGPRPMEHEWPNYTHHGSYIAATYGTDDNFQAPYALHNNENPVVNNTAGSIVGYKYFNFTKTSGRDLTLHLVLTPTGASGTIRIMADSPWTSCGGTCVGTIQLNADMSQVPTELSALLTTASLTGKHAIFFCFDSPEQSQSLCTLHNFIFKFA